MSLKDKWKQFGKNTGKAFTNFGKAVGKTAKVVFTDEENGKDADGDTELGNAWRETGKSFGRAGKSLGEAAEGTADKIIGDEESASSKKIILLNGASSSGKTTIAGVLQSMVEEKRNEKYKVISIDDFLVMNANTALNEDDIYNASLELNKKVVEEIKENRGIILVHIITSERILNELKNTIEQYQLLAVCVDCPLNVLEDRERLRGDRLIGSAEYSSNNLYPQEGYDLTIDTNANSVDECVSLIYKRIGI